MKINSKINLALILLLLPIFSYSQTTKDWPFSDPTQDSTLGMSVNKAYNLLKNKKSTPVIVAVIDNGIDLKHEDLQGVIWTNTKEIPDNGIDDDNNGFIDDIHGWNFLGNADGNNLKLETIELTRYCAYFKKMYANKSENDFHDKDSAFEFQKYATAIQEFTELVNKKHEELDTYQRFFVKYSDAFNQVAAFYNRINFSEQEIRDIKETKGELYDAKTFLLYCLDKNITRDVIQKQISSCENELNTRLNMDLKNRTEIVKDNPDDINDSIYGNNKVDACGPYHGTGVASIIAALNNDKGIDGIAQNVKIMTIRIVPNGDERDKDIALAIKYAIRNGASIINCSFAKKYTIHPEYLTDAIEEAEKAGVLIVHASGNWASNNDKTPYYPTGQLSNGKIANNWITVGASASKDDENLVAEFSNYGAKSVDVFAPGVNIKSCALNNKYDAGSGTSIAAPEVAGVAAVLKSYYPKLTAAQLKQILIRSVYIPKTKEVILPGDTKKVNFNRLSLSGGIVNLYKAIQLIEKEYLK